MKFLPTVSSTLLPQQNEKVARDFKRIFAVILINDRFPYVLFIYLDSISLCSAGCPGAHYPEQVEIQRNSPASAFRVLASKAHTQEAEKF